MNMARHGHSRLAKCSAKDPMQRWLLDGSQGAAYEVCEMRSQQQGIYASAHSCSALLTVVLDQRVSQCHCRSW